MKETERDQLAQRLSAMSWKDARREIERLDPEAVLKYFRNSYHDEYRTLYVLPRRGISVTLVEKQDADVLNEQVLTDFGKKKLRVEFDYIGARVEPLGRPAEKFVAEPHSSSAV